jgi:hypothetical protein
MEQGKHLNPQGLQEIVAIRESLNEGRGRRRKYNGADVEIDYQGILRDYTPDSKTI